MHLAARNNALFNIRFPVIHASQAHSRAKTGNSPEFARAAPRAPAPRV